jgi:Na+-transporting NADH:ubiquinone oxidoreductase subunit NqrF
LTNVHVLFFAVRCGRISKEDIQSSLDFLKAPEPPMVFICGPPLMAEAIEDILHSLGMAEPDIFYEKWW